MELKRKSGICISIHLRVCQAAGLRVISVILLKQVSSGGSCQIPQNRHPGKNRGLEVIEKPKFRLSPE